MSTVVAIVDYGTGNVHSVRHALAMAGAEVVLTSEPRELERASRIVLPGVGAFGECMKNLRASGLIETLSTEVRTKGKPMLGICLGMQLLASGSEERGEHEGLGWIPGRVKHLDVRGKGLRVPHVGWNEVKPAGAAHPIFRGIKRDATFYFVHSYVLVPDAAEHTIATCDYGGDFTCAIARDNIVATQFHPEKSQQNGLALLEAFLAWNP